ncbi:hypothetical protein ATANTOWER_009986 [Ataeniobius toweri]|uniref:Uncharacterized protein n=1 Tax=Ataeniobius toweri TaxID=208326 RepID=A0ABU7AFN2_9TELE|nr:hypothetical protein [Ataeniobius toweri]
MFSCGEACGTAGLNSQLSSLNLSVGQIILGAFPPKEISFLNCFNSALTCPRMTSRFVQKNFQGLEWVLNCIGGKGVPVIPTNLFHRFPLVMYYFGLPPGPL